MVWVPRRHDQSLICSQTDLNTKGKVDYIQCMYTHNLEKKSSIVRQSHRPVSPIQDIIELLTNSRTYQTGITHYSHMRVLSHRIQQCQSTDITDQRCVRPITHNKGSVSSIVSKKSCNGDGTIIINVVDTNVQYFQMSIIAQGFNQRNRTRGTNLIGAQVRGPNVGGGDSSQGLWPVATLLLVEFCPRKDRAFPIHHCWREQKQNWPWHLHPTLRSEGGNISHFC